MFSESTQSFLMMAVQVKRCVDYRIELFIIKLKYSGVFTCINNEGLENFTHQLYIAIISVTWIFCNSIFFLGGFLYDFIIIIAINGFTNIMPCKDHFNQVFSI